MGISLSSLGGLAGFIPVVGGTAEKILTTADKLVGGGGGTPTGFPYPGEASLPRAPGQIPDVYVEQILREGDSTDRATLQQAYIGARPKAGPWYSSVVTANPAFITIAAAGGGDYKRNDGEARLHNTIANLAGKYGIAMIPQVTANSTSAGQLAIQALSRAWDAAKTAATGSLAESAQPAIREAASRSAQQKFSDNGPLLIGAAVVGALVVLVVRGGFK